jgi:hypothetical protein
MKFNRKQDLLLKFLKLLSFLAVVTCAACTTPITVGQVIKQYDYLEINPPSKLVPPGTVIQVMQKDPLVVHIICSQKSALGDKFNLPESPTSDLALVRAVTQTFNVDSDLLQKLKQNTQFKSIKNIKMSIKNAKISEIPDDQIFAHILDRSLDCQNAIDYYFSHSNTKEGLQEAASVSMVESTLTGDVIYTVELDERINIDMSTKNEILTELALQLGGSKVNVNNQTISGEGLIWGIRERNHMLALRIDERCKDSDINGYWQKLDDNLVLQIVQKGCDVLLDSNSQEFKYKVTKSYQSPFKLNYVLTKTSSKCEAEIYGILRKIDRDHLKSEVFGTNGKCGMAMGFKDESVWTRK